MGFNPLITFIVVTKRHHTRFFGTSNNVVDDKGNVVPGTVIDTDVTSSDKWDFYLNSHKGIQVGSLALLMLFYIMSHIPQHLLYERYISGSVKADFFFFGSANFLLERVPTNLRSTLCLLMRTR